MDDLQINTKHYYWLQFKSNLYEMKYKEMLDKLNICEMEKNDILYTLEKQNNALVTS